MIKVDNIQVDGFYPAIIGMRNPMNSHHKIDSYFSDFTYDGKNGFVLGDNDLDLMRRLYQGGSEHRKYLRQIQVWMSIQAPLYWWKEADTYRIGVTANSQSTMHKIHAKEFVLDDFSHEHLMARAEFNLKKTIDTLNHYRGRFIATNDKLYWWQMIQLLPTSYNQTRMVSMNYEVAVNMIHQREHHKLDEWRDFVQILKGLPYLEQIMQNQK